MSERPRKHSWKVPRGHEVVPGRRVIERLGGGGRTEVYRCTDDATGTPVVVKVLRPGRTDEADVRMLRRESQTLAVLDHPGFPRLLDADLDTEPAWLAMTQVDGPHLSNLVRSHGPIEVEQAVPLALDVADALAHLHDRGHVHLDVKPSNVVMGARPVLLGLGASRTTERAARLRPGVGTSSYLSPEQAVPGELGVPGPPSDIWGLGITLLVALADTNPLAARRDDHEVDEVALAETCRAVAQAHVPAPLRAFVVACLATDPADRPAPTDVAALLGGARDGSAGVLRRVSPFFPPARPPRDDEEPLRAATGAPHPRIGRWSRQTRGSRCRGPEEVTRCATCSAPP